jgi:hypothetical protein
MRVTPAQVTLEHDKMDAKIKAFTRDNAEEEDDRVRDAEPSE